MKIENPFWIAFYAYLGWHFLEAVWGFLLRLAEEVIKRGRI